MDSAIQLIQLTLRVEREAEAQRHPYMTHRDDLADEKPVGPSRRVNRIKRNFDLLHRKQQCECA